MNTPNIAIKLETIDLHDQTDIGIDHDSFSRSLVLLVERVVFAPVTVSDDVIALVVNVSAHQAQGVERGIHLNETTGFDARLTVTR